MSRRDTDPSGGANDRTPDGEPVIHLRGVRKSYRRGAEELRVLDDVDLDIEKKGFYALMGPSGSGKTTLLNLIGGLDQADAGTVRVAGEDLSELSSGELAQWRSDTIGFVFQGFNLLPVLTAYENVALPLLLTPLSRKERKEHALYALELVGLADRASHRPSQLSGGQEQRVAIARAVVSDPAVILADEPTGDLDRASADQILDLLDRLNAEFGKTIVMVTHDQKAAASAHTLVHMDKGQIGSAEPAAAAAADDASGGSARSTAASSPSRTERSS